MPQPVQSFHTLLECQNAITQSLLPTNFENCNFFHITIFQKRASYGSGRKSGTKHFKQRASLQCTKFHQHISKIATCGMNTNLHKQTSDGQTGLDRFKNHSEQKVALRVSPCYIRLHELNILCTTCGIGYNRLLALLNTARLIEQVKIASTKPMSTSANPKSGRVYFRHNQKENSVDEGVTLIGCGYTHQTAANCLSFVISF